MKTLAYIVFVSLVASGASAQFAEASLDPDDIAAINDDFEVRTTDPGRCGAANFVDYGPGAPGGGNNDDYIVIHDYCADGHGVRVWAWIADESGQHELKSVYNGNGEDGDAVVWDPFKAFNPDENVGPGDGVILRVCLVDGRGDMSGASCHTIGSVSEDG